MRFIVPVVAAVLASSGAAQAMPVSAKPASAMPASAKPVAASDLMPVAMGCGVGRTRDAMGRCHHPFNRFEQHRGFQAYKRRHCTPLHTPNGTVGFCKV